MTTTTTLSTVPTFPIIFVPHKREIDSWDCESGVHPDCVDCDANCTAAGRFVMAFIEQAVGGFYRPEAQ